MKKLSLLLMAGAIILSCCVIISCNQPEKKDTAAEQPAHKFPAGYDSPESYGGHLVAIMGCEHCHTPKKMSAMGPVMDSSLRLSGHPASMPDFDIDRKAMAAKGLVVTSDLTAWAGPWGISYAANITPDDTGIGNWSEEQFFICLRQGKHHGMASGRTLLPPMPWEEFANVSDDELSAIFSYLKTVKPVENIVPDAKPPAQ